MDNRDIAIRAFMDGWEELLEKDAGVATWLLKALRPAAGKIVGGFKSIPKVQEGIGKLPGFFKSLFGPKTVLEGMPTKYLKYPVGLAPESGNPGKILRWFMGGATKGDILRKRQAEWAQEFYKKLSTFSGKNIDDLIKNPQIADKLHIDMVKRYMAGKQSGFAKRFSDIVASDVAKGDYNRIMPYIMRAGVPAAMGAGTLSMAGTSIPELATSAYDVIKPGVERIAEGALGKSKPSTKGDESKGLWGTIGSAMGNLPGIKQLRESYPNLVWPLGISTGVALLLSYLAMEENLSKDRYRSMGYTSPVSPELIAAIRQGEIQ